MRRDHITAALPASMQHSAAPPGGWPETALPAEWTGRILQRMRALYGARFDQLWQGFDADALLRQWSAELAGLRPDQLGRGMRALATHDAPPTIPQFLNLCRLNPRTAYYEALAGLRARERGAVGEWSDPAIFWAACAVGAFDLKTQPYRRLRARWQAALATAQAASYSAPIPAPCRPAARAPGADPHATPGRGAPKPALAEVLAEPAEAGPNDPKRWARSILARRAAGDPAVTAYQVRCAQTALR